MRAQVTELLRNRQSPENQPPPPTDEILLVNELVKEYLEWNGYLYTASVMSSEAAMPMVKKSRYAKRTLCISSHNNNDKHFFCLLDVE